MNIVKDMRLEVFFLMIAAIIFSGCGQSGEKEASSANYDLQCSTQENGTTKLSIETQGKAGSSSLRT